MAPPTIPLIERFWSRVDKSPGFGPWGNCWRWTGAPGADGYGHISIKSVKGRCFPVGAHRLSYEIHKGRIPRGLETRHACNVRLCVNPDHLSVGTSKENSEDKNLHGTMARGERNGCAKLTEEDVRTIRREHQTGRWSNLALGRRFGVSGTAIYYILIRQNWRHVP